MHRGQTAWSSNRSFFFANRAADRRAVQFRHLPIQQRQARTILLTPLFSGSHAIFAPLPRHRRPVIEFFPLTAGKLRRHRRLEFSLLKLEGFHLQ